MCRRHTDRQTDTERDSKTEKDRDISVKVYKPAHDRVSVGMCRRHTDRQTDIERDS